MEDGAWIAKPWDSSVGVGTGRGELMNSILPFWCDNSTVAISWSILLVLLCWFTLQDVYVHEFILESAFMIIC